jgi:hypothetical protein
MGRQLNIRSDRARALAAELAARHSKPVTRIVEEALEAYAKADRGKEEREDRETTLRQWRELLEEDRKYLNDSDFEIDDLYDPETGLPA